MIFLHLFLVFSKIGLFNFGGGYAMLSFIQSEVVARQGWMTEQEFADIVAISNMTPGPIGINCATYVGYTAVMNNAALAESTSPEILHLYGVVGSVLATLSVLWLPFLVMLLISRFLLRHKGSPIVESVFAGLRPAIIGLIASAALGMMTPANFGSPTADTVTFVLSLAIAVIVFVGSRRLSWKPIPVLLACAGLGIVLYGILGL